MAKQTITRVLDDLDGSEGAEPLEFGFEGVDYAIDLTAEHAQEFRDAVQKYVSAARRVARGGGRGVATGRRPAPTAADREQNNAIREWARRNNYKVSDRGRIPSNVLDAYHRAV